MAKAKHRHDYRHGKGLMWAEDAQGNYKGFQPFRECRCGARIQDHFNAVQRSLLRAAEQLCQDPKARARG